ncbi:MAG: hypothetical protein DMF97_13550 [Acidobacteria bacterium]|nr:MAG: hypothetical protein DMF97_13550 [Acidobacteriota bacterium]
MHVGPRWWRRRVGWQAHAQRDRRHGRGEDERIGHAGRALNRRERLLDGNGGEAGRRRTRAIGQRLDADQSWPERARRDKQRWLAVDAGGGQIGHTAGPRERRGVRAIDGHAGSAGLLDGERRVHRIEQPRHRGGVARRPRNRVARGGGA